LRKETFKFNKKLKIILISIIVIALSISIYFILIGILNHIKTIKYTNLINSETQKFNSTNFEDSRYNYLKLYNKNINNTNDQNNYYNSNLIEPGNYFTLEINLKNRYICPKMKEEKYMIAFDIPAEENSFKKKINQILKKSGAEMVQRSIWASENLELFLRLAVLIKNVGGKANVFEAKVIFS